MNGNHEFDLFREMMANVAPMQQDTIEKSTGAHQPSESQLARQLSAQKMSESDLNYLSIDEATMLKPDDVVSYKRPGIQDGVFRKLRLGKYDIQARLDLHKFSLEEARQELMNFVRQCQRMDVRAMVIVHGKGERCHPQAQMKSFVCQWLTQISEVQCYHSAQRHHGGTGALYLLLKKSAEKKQENRERHLNRRSE